jgi:hypothetical protein
MRVDICMVVFLGMGVYSAGTDGRAFTASLVRPLASFDVHQVAGATC